MIAFAALIVAAIALVIVIQPPPPPEGCWHAPRVYFLTPEHLSGTEWEVEVDEVTYSCDSPLFRVILLANGTVVSDMNPLDGEASGNITFADSIRSGKLSAGDVFVVSTAPSTQYELAIVWQETGNQLGLADWET